MNQSRGDHPFLHLVDTLSLSDDESLNFFSLPKLNDDRLSTLPYSIRFLLESAIRNCDQHEVTTQHVQQILEWTPQAATDASSEIPFKPARVLLQDYTGIPSLVDLAAMRDTMHRLNGDPKQINPLVPVDLVIDHSVQVDYSRASDSLEKNQAMEYQRNAERFSFLKWGAQAFKNLQIIPPGSGIVHQINLEYLARLCFNTSGMAYPDSLVGTDSHTTMICGLGVVGWGVGGIEAEAVMLGQPISMKLPEVIGCKLIGTLSSVATATDLVLTVTELLRKLGVVGKFVEFFGSGCACLSVADRATISNMSPEYGATMGYFPVDHQTLNYLRQTGRDEKKVAMIEKYFRAQGLLRVYDGTQADPLYSDVVTLDLSNVTPCIAGPKRPQDRIPLINIKSDFLSCLINKIGFKGFGLQLADTKRKATFNYEGSSYTISHGSVVIASITSCTNTSNPGVMLGAALLAKNALAKGLKVLPYIKTSLSPGSGVVVDYLNSSGLMKSLEGLGFFLAGFGCMTCIGNSGDLDTAVSKAIQNSDLVVAAVLSGNRNFEGRVHPLTRANFLASPPLCVAFALAGRIDIDFEVEPIGIGSDGNPVHLRDIWPNKSDIESIENLHLKPLQFSACYKAVSIGNQRWNDLKVPEGVMYSWGNSSYIINPPFFDDMQIEPPQINNLENAHCLLNLGNSVTTDHISPAGKIAASSPAAKYLLDKGISIKDFNSYGARRGNSDIMTRGTFANIRLVNKMASKTGPLTLHVPTSQEMSVFDAADFYKRQGFDLIILAGEEYGSGSSRDWAAKGPFLMGVKAVIAESFERIHRSNLVGMGILPLQFKRGESADKLKLTGKEQYSIAISEIATPGCNVTVKVSDGRQFEVLCRVDTEVELAYFKNGGILQYVLRKFLKK